jgi:flavin-dependent dehydrogenase
MVQTMALEGLKIPSKVIQRGIDSYVLHTKKGHVRIDTPVREKSIATVYRGGGPRGRSISERESFDDFLLKRAVESGAEHVSQPVDRVIFEKGHPVLYSRGNRLMEADLVVGAYGVNSPKAPTFEGGPFQRSSPKTAKAVIAEIILDPDIVRKHFGTSVHFFLLPIKRIKFAALIPKHSYVTLCILGKDLDEEKIVEFLSHPGVRGLFPEGEIFNSVGCLCLPMMNVGAPARPYADRAVMIGDTGSTRLYKDGLGAAYFLGKSAAKTVIMHGVGQEDFRKRYMPDYRSLVTDNWYGRYLYMVTNFFRDYNPLTSAMLDVVRREQGNERDKSMVLSNVLWDMFTGNERFRRVFRRATSPELVLKMTKSLTNQVFGGPFYES